MNPESSLISKVVFYEEAIAKVLEAKISYRYFHDPDQAEVWEWIEGFYAEYGKAPDRVTMRAQYPNYELAKVPEPIDFYIDQIRAAHKRFEALSMLGEATAAFKEEAIDEALGVLSDGLVSIAQDTSVTTDEEIVSTWEDRLKVYAEIEEGAGDLIGIPTGFPMIDDATGGLQPEQFIVLIGPQKAGKSSILLKIGQHANDQGYAVLFFTFEMSNLEQMARYDGLRAGINYNKILQGKLNLLDKMKLQKEMQRFKNNPPFQLVHDMHSTTTLAAVTAKVQQYKPDLVIVDGLYMMDSEVEGAEASDTRSLTKLSRGLKRMAQTQKIPLLTSTQALEHKYSKSKGLTASATGYTSAFGQDCDLMLGIEPGEDDDSVISKLRIVTGRNARRRFAWIKLDWEHGLIEEADFDNDDDGDDD